MGRSATNCGERYFIAHAPHGFWTILNRGESPVLLCFIFLFFAVFGGGFFSLDTLLGRGGRVVIGG